MSKNTLDNGTGRKQLADQLDRLDGILDGVADSLNEAIAATVEKAVSAAVKEAVEAVLVEVLTNPAFQQLQKAAAPTPEPVASEKKTSNSPSKLSSLWGWVCNKVRSVAGVCTSTVGKVYRGACLAWQATGGVVRGLMLAGTGIVAGVAYTTRSSIRSAASTVVGLGKTLIAKAGNALASLLPAFAFGT